MSWTFTARLKAAVHSTIPARSLFRALVFHKILSKHKADVISFSFRKTSKQKIKWISVCFVILANYVLFLPCKLDFYSQGQTPVFFFFFFWWANFTPFSQYLQLLGWGSPCMPLANMFLLAILNYCCLWRRENVFLCQNGNGRHTWQSLFLKIWDCTKLSVFKMTLWHSLSLRWCLSFLTPAVPDSWNGSRR